MTEREYAGSTIITVNTGSSSVRLAAFACDEGLTLSALATEHHALIGEDALEVLRRFVGANVSGGVAAVAHRVVHGGRRLVKACLLDEAAEHEIARLAPLAPLHNPTALHWIGAARSLLGEGTPQVGVFDTAFYANLPEVAKTYAIPRVLADRHEIRRYGFHGLAHQAMWRRWQALHPDRAHDARIISLQLGSGCSVTAIEGGVPKDTSMGFSPLEGLVMATRSGDVDPGVISFLQRVEHWSPEDVDRVLSAESGLLGLSGSSGDMRELLRAEDPHARIAVELYAYRARKYIGAYLTVLGGADAIVFGGGVGEHAPAVRAAILKDMEWAGVRLDAGANETTEAKTGRISHPDSKIEVWVIPVDEQQILAQEALAVITRQ
ncbi:MAG: acetate/propionate family kinase [Gammaproteobacteria bacterium]|nr:acetate/propionate family kinase [Gammaproteobacteria bacterium]MBU1732546.1 acetate/propionate family kinase [Gammaproteobacteria bacterium]MBU1893409.1 acetate/propionate family kinase [Gammaproteobacteria bacterium]